MYSKGEAVRFSFPAYFETDIPSDIAHWERRAFSNPESARRFAEMIHESQINEIIEKTIFAAHGGWIIVGFGTPLPSWKFQESYRELYDELAVKVGGVYLEGISDFNDFLASDWINELSMTVFSEKIDQLYQYPVRSKALANAKIRLRTLAQEVESENLAELLEDVEDRYLALNPHIKEPVKILELTKLCTTIIESAVQQIYTHKKLGKIGQQTLGQLAKRIISEETVPRRIGFEIQALVPYRNKAEHSNVTDQAEYELSESDLELIMSHMLDIVEYCLAQGILPRRHNQNATKS